MVGLVIVAHSRALAEALVGLVRQVASVEVPIAIAAGAGDGHLDFGTDAAEIAQAIQEVYSPAGVVILVDMGSAILSAEMALEFSARGDAPQGRDLLRAAGGRRHCGWSPGQPGQRPGKRAATKRRRRLSQRSST